MSKFESSPVVREFSKQCSNHPELCTHIIAGVSGGPDSMALLYLLNRTGIKTTAVHCNYGLRGKASDSDQELVEKMCGMWGFDCISVRLDYEVEGEGNFQNWARNRRYEIFSDLYRELGAASVATAHHSDDQVETIIQKVLRGAGTASWKGMSTRDGWLFRPLLEVSKQDIMQFVQEFNIPYRIDGSNEESTYARNFLRHNWFPELDRLFPGWRENLLRLPDRAAEFEEMADHILSGISEHPERLTRPGFLSLHNAIRPVVLHRFVEKSGAGFLPSVSFLEACNELEHLQTGKRLQLSGELSIIRDRELFHLISENRTGVEPVTITRKAAKKGSDVHDFTFAEEPFSGFDNPEVLYQDVQKFGYPVTVRRWKEGDQFTPLGMDGSQLVSDHLTNRKVSSARKGEAMVVQSFDGNICAVIFPHNSAEGRIGTISESVRCGPDTQNVLTIRKKD
jgi:tRNA(Ile)-lysidine synthase